jgi:hypothetical protein
MNELSAVGFQMLEGLQGTKHHLRLLLENITQFWTLISIIRGKSETSQAVHTGNVQLRAYF